MRKVFSETIYKFLHKDKKIVVLLGDIGVYSFNKVNKKFNKNIFNIGILEQTMVGVAAGMAINGKIPFVHTISPFVINRAFEQIKVDLCYQNLNVNIVTVGSSIDYAALGCTHHCPEDIAIINKLPNIKIYYPGNPSEFKKLLLNYKENSPKYYRLSNDSHKLNIKIYKNKASIIKKGKKATIVVFGASITLIEDIINEIDATILYYTTLKPFDKTTLRKNLKNNKVIIIQDFYNGSLTYEINESINNSNLYEIGIPNKFRTNYGNKKLHLKRLNLDKISILKRIKKIIDE